MRHRETSWDILIHVLRLSFHSHHAVADSRVWLRAELVRLVSWPSVGCELVSSHSQRRFNGTRNTRDKTGPVAGIRQWVQTRRTAQSSGRVRANPYLTTDRDSQVCSWLKGLGLCYVGKLRFQTQEFHKFLKFSLCQSYFVHLLLFHIFGFL